MNLLANGAELLAKRLGLNIDVDTITNALGSLLGNADGELDLSGLASRFASSGGAAAALQSWLGDGDNEPISGQTIMDALGERNVAEFADTVGTDTETAASGLSDIIPQLMDQASPGGELLSSLGGAGGLLGMAKSFLR